MLTMGYANRPRDDKVSDGGDDAWFVTNSVVNAVGVADGVGSWRDQGINAGECAREIMNTCKDYFTHAGTSPCAALSEAESHSTKPGSTTAIVAQYHDIGLLEVCQVGDSNLVVIRDNYVLYQTSSQVRYHNSPYQIGAGATDTVKTHSKRYNFSVEKGDIIILGSDGLWDNLYPAQAMQMVKLSGLKSATSIARLLTSIAYELSQDKQMWSPFAQDAYEDGQMPTPMTSEDKKRWKGGKPDDITVVVAIVQE